MGQRPTPLSRPSGTAGLLDRTEWTVVWLVLGLLAVPVAVAYAATFPGPATPGHGTQAVADDARVAGDVTTSTMSGVRLLRATARERGVVLAAIFLTV